jgi:hypothetical protein
MTAAISGGALFSPIQTVVAKAPHRSLQYSFCVPLAAFAFGSIFAIYLNVVPAARNQVDPVHEHRDRQRHARKALTGASSGFDMASPRHQFGLTGILARRKHKADGPSSEHVERRGSGNGSSSSPAHWMPNEKIAQLDVPTRPRPVRKMAHVRHVNDSAQPPSEARQKSTRNVRVLASPSEEDRIHPFTSHRSAGGGDTTPGLPPWPDEPADGKEREILFGKSISSAL